MGRDPVDDRAVAHPGPGVALELVEVVGRREQPEHLDVSGDEREQDVAVGELEDVEDPSHDEGDDDDQDDGRGRRGQQDPRCVSRAAIEDVGVGEGLVEGRGVDEALAVLLEIALGRVEREEGDEQAGDEGELGGGPAAEAGAWRRVPGRPSPGRIARRSDDRATLHRERREPQRGPEPAQHQDQGDERGDGGQRQDQPGQGRVVLADVDRQPDDPTVSRGTEEVDGDQPRPVTAEQSPATRDDGCRLDLEPPQPVHTVEFRGRDHAVRPTRAPWPRAGWRPRGRRRRRGPRRASARPGPDRRGRRRRPRAR